MAIWSVGDNLARCGKSVRCGNLARWWKFGMFHSDSDFFDELKKINISNGKLLMKVPSNRIKLYIRYFMVS